ncbi:MAG: FixH family protein [Nitrospinae bacterium]|nr:FixH family protein [Nitrospinota bacterium]
MREERVAEPFWKSPFILGMAALVGAAVTANLVMVAFAVTGAPGLVSDDYYARGKSYTSRTRVDYLAPRGGTATVTGLDRLRVGVATPLTVTGVEGATAVTLHAYRPADAAADFSATLAPDGAAADARFGGAVTFPLKGSWDLIVEPLGADGAPLPGIARRVRVGE